MPKRVTPLIADQIYHIYNRGVNKELIFFSDRNYRFFLNRLSKFILHNASILAYCLMPNHFHLLLRVNTDKFVPSSMQPFLVSYSKAINIEQDRVGPLFQGRYQSTLISDESYLLDCMKYIHLNPVKAGLVTSPDLWKYSSYTSYLHPEVVPIVDTSLVMSYFDDISELKEYIEFGLDQYESKIFSDS